MYNNKTASDVFIRSKFHYIIEIINYIHFYYEKLHLFLLGRYSYTEFKKK